MSFTGYYPETVGLYEILKSKLFIDLVNIKTQLGYDSLEIEEVFYIGD